MKLVRLLDSVGFPRDRQRIVINRYMGRNGCISPPDVAVRLDRDVDHVVPYDTALIAAANMGRPFIGRGWRISRSGRSVAAIVSEVEQLSTSHPESNGQNGRLAAKDAEHHA